MKKVLEVIVLNKDEAIIAEKNGADRLELISNFDKGGLSPTLEMIKEVTTAVSIPVNVMVRNKDESFMLSSVEVNDLIKFIKRIKHETNANGIVFGSLNKNNCVDKKQLIKIVKAAGKMDVIFHRAFDQTTHAPKKQASIIAKCKVNGLLTSGTKDSAVQGKHIIKEIINATKKYRNFNVIVGSGVSFDNLVELIETTKAKHYHVGSSVRVGNKVYGNLEPEKINQIKQLLLRKG